MIKTFQPYLALSIFFSPVFLYAETHNEVPSEEMLEFLLEFDDADDETFEMMIKNGIRDNEQAEIEQILNQNEDGDSVSEQQGTSKRPSKREV